MEETRTQSLRSSFTLDSGNRLTISMSYQVDRDGRPAAELPKPHYNFEQEPTEADKAEAIIRLREAVAEVGLTPDSVSA